MKLRFSRLLGAMIAVIVLLAAVPCFAQEDIADRIQAKYDTLKTFQGKFVQVLTNAASQESEIRSGDIWFKQPALVRWDTVEPEKELLIIGKDAAWDYFEEDMTAFKYSIEGLLDSKTILRFISGQANLREDFILKTEWIGDDDVRNEWGGNLTVLQLTPKEPEPGMVQAYIGVDKESALLKRIMIVDFMGNGNDVTLHSIETGKEISADMFEFTPPENVVVEDNTGSY